MELVGAGVDAGIYTVFDNSVAAHDSIENVYDTELGKGESLHWRGVLSVTLGKYRS